jgi:hypothetical protein
MNQRRYMIVDERMSLRGIAEIIVDIVIKRNVQKRIWLRKEAN